MLRRVGKEVAQQVEVAPVSPRHFEGENSPKHLPPISPLADRSYGNPIYRNDDEEKVDSTESSNKISQELQQIRKLQEEANQNMERSLQSFLQAQRQHSDHFTQCLNVIERAIHDNSRAIREEVAESRRTFTAVSERTMEHVRQQQNVPRQPVPRAMELPQQNLPDPLPGGHINQPQFNRQQQNNPASGILGPQDPVEAAFRAAKQLNANQQRYVPPARRPNAAPQPNFQNNAFQPLGLQATPPPLDRNQLIDLVQETYGPALRPLVCPSYHKPYPDYIDRDNPFPRGFKVPEFTLFSGDASQSTIEHIGRFTIQCGEALGDDFLKLRLFPSSLTGTALTWYLSLSQNSVFTWRQIEDLFHIQFYHSEPEISMADLSRLTQRLRESSENYLMRFRKAQMKCHVALPEQEFVKLAQNGLDIELRKKFEGMEFRDFFELSYKVARYENLLREESQRKAASQGTYYQDAFDLDVAEVFADKPVTCPNLVKVTQQVEAAAKRLPYESGRQYTFDVTKANEIFDYLKKSGHIKLPQGHRLPTDKIDKGLLRFLEKPKEAMGIDENPFPNIDVGVNVADIRSISQRTYKGRTLAADDLRWVIEKERERRAQQNQRLGGQHHAARIYAAGSKMKEARHTDRSRMVKPPQRPPSRRWEKVVHPKFPKEPVRNPRTLRRRLQQKRAEAHRHQQLATEEVKVPQRSLAKGRMVWKRKESQEVAVQNESQPKVPPPKLTSLIINENELKATFEADQQAELTRDDNFLEDMDVLQIGSISINLSCLVLTLPLVFQAKGSETTHVSNGSMLVEEEVIEPLYISAHMDGVPVNRVLVDNGAAVNVIPSFMLRNLGKNSEDWVYTDVTISDFTGGVSKSKGVLLVALTVGSKTSMSAFFVVDSSATYNALLGRDWIHSNWCVPSTLHQRLIFWNGGKTEVVYADNRPFLTNSNMAEARYYDEDVGTIRFFGMDRQGRPRGISACNKPTLTKYVVDEKSKISKERREAVSEILKKLAAYFAERNTEPNLSEVVHEGEEDTHTDGITMEELDLAPAKLDDLRANVQDPLKKVNLGTEAEPRITFFSGLLPPEMRDKIICLPHEFKDCFAWDYSEMPGLDRELVEHRLPINKGYKPYKQPPRRMSPEVILKVKEEVERLHKVGFIRTARYSEWLSNIVPIVKKNGKLRVCIDFRNLNLVTPKDEYPMPVADLLVDGVARHRILSFMDGYSGYNQIFIAEEDISKTAFRCPGNIGTYEWVVMPFGLKNAGATYQRAMNAIFHDMIGRFMEIYIDDVVVKSMEDEEHLEHLRKAFERMRQHGLKMNPLKCAFGVIAGNFLGFLVHERGLEPDADFKWERQHQAAFDAIKEYLSKTPVLVPPVKNKPLLLYISAADESIGCLLAQENNNKQEQTVYYLSRALNPTEVKYSSVEKLCLALFFAAIKLRHYLLYSEVFVVSKTDVIKYMLSRPLLRGRIGKWILALTEFNLRYLPQKAVKGQALADFLADHPCLDVNADEDKGINLFSIDLVPWRLIFYGSSTDRASGAGIIIVSPDGIKPNELKVPSVEIVGDSQLVLKQLSGKYKCTSVVLSPYFATAIQLLEEFDDVSLKHIPRNMNIEANELAQIASGVKMLEGILEKVVVIEKRILPSIHQRGIMVEACSLDVTPTDWRHPIIEHLRNPSSKTSRRTRMQTLNYVLLGDVLYRRGQDELLLRCLGLDESYHVMSNVHNDIKKPKRTILEIRPVFSRGKVHLDVVEGLALAEVVVIGSSEEAGSWVRTRELVANPGSWDCINYAKGCRAYQLHGPLQRAPASELHPIVKPWPFRGLAIDLIGKIYPPSSKGHSFIIVATDYFTKWVEARPMKKVEQGDVIKFIKEDPIHRTSQRSSTKVTPFSLTYGHDAVLPMELTARSLRIAIQNGLNYGEYNEAMIMELEDLEEARLTALDVMKAQKLKVARAYNKRVKQKNLAEGRLVWKAVLPLGKKDPRYASLFAAKASRPSSLSSTSNLLLSALRDLRLLPCCNSRAGNWLAMAAMA
ncbi:hypothetical protein SLEP1_g23931 [Rubroshorea leprosula]|uniref:Peptidase A2 domain-containing protein n=1 Tax=Rubroshorea leprosula TaxID=152421 RepID=A0AAV5JH00_9ROSI|nr:hypothetical protein SLEP1_g23931 [Rubroshorea leprosula]